MTSTRWSTIAALALFVTVACDQQPRLDLSSNEALGASIAKVNASLSEQERKRFSDAFATVTQHALGGGLEEAQNAPGARGRLAQALSGKTAAQVIADAEAIRSQEGTAAN